MKRWLFELKKIFVDNAPADAIVFWKDDTSNAGRRKVYSMKKLAIIFIIIVSTLAAGGALAWQPLSRVSVPIVASRPMQAPALPKEKISAFPGAEGFGAQAVGGRGGEVIEVTNLRNAGTGSLRACIQASGPRTCVFRVAGTIELKSTLEIQNPFITIAGQTAPGGGITLKVADPANSMDILQVSTHDVIIRYIRSRPGTKAENARALSINAGSQVTDENKMAYNIMIDHVSLSWAGDELLIAWDRTHHVTVQWSIIAESLPPGLKGPNLGKDGGGFYSVHHNLIAHHAYRTPNISASSGPTDLVNNVVYNFRRYGARILLGARVNIVNNYIKAGPDTLVGAYFVKDDLDVPDPDSDGPLPNPDTRGFYVSGNVIQDSSDDSNGKNRIEGILPPNTSSKDIRSLPYDAAVVTTTTAESAYTEVLGRAGAIHGLNCDGSWFERPDSVDIRIVSSVLQDRSSDNNAEVKTGYIANPSEVGGWPVLDPGTPCIDSDHDGMPDEWEIARGSDPLANNSADVMPDGYTRLEHYLNGNGQSSER